VHRGRAGRHDSTTSSQATASAPPSTSPPTTTTRVSVGNCARQASMTGHRLACVTITLAPESFTWYVTSRSRYDGSSARDRASLLAA